ncbi:type VI secretion system Vgr family protein [Paracoccus tegillarcae]|uniref:Type VI secretion system tip protein VgrG n=1 Tax=Paracoccus tegillarcae TaxID=1529068 RepID=A0A2K9EFG9_9RHOB|nr:type VI secretion system tip protein TssI/VgrG [Paracoccus tegillarcae]AUH33089.1 type VI secretion system tip protein VgrG [Paracoccus tegillarcae]
MNAPFKQAERLGRLTTELGPDVLVLLRFDGSDHLNDLFEYRVEALAIRDDLDFDALVGTHATVEIEAHEVMRPFDGIVTSARWAGVGENGHRYDLTLRPWFWLAGRRRNQRIFHNKTVIQILQELLSDYAGLGDPALEISLSKDYPILEYTVQYRESDLDFARRQMERHGISFHFKHAMGSHTLVLTDDVLAHEEIGARPFKRYDGHHQYEQEHFWDWAPERNITTGAVRLADYNFKKPTQAMEVDRLGDAQHAQGQIESFDYPGDYLAQGVGKLVAGLRTEQERGADRRNRAAGDCVSLGAGMRMTLSGDKVPGTGETYLCLSASHHFVSEAYGTGGQGSDGYSFTGSYVLMPDTAPMAPPKRTPLAVVQGPQTAEVVGEGEIDCDEYGRILVRFHWDLANAYSMRCRVSQNWAGAGWGGMVIPRIGMEVVVEFLEGDPDKPLVTGNVFNGKNDAPYQLPANKTRAVWRSNTHQGQGFNEISFEDQSGIEDMFFHAQKDLTTKVLNNSSANIGANRVDNIANNASLVIGDNAVERVGRNKNVTIGGGGAGLLGMLMPLLQAGGKLFRKSGQKAGLGPVTGMGGYVAGGKELPVEVMTLLGNAGFSQSGDHRSGQGVSQSGKAASLAGQIGSLLGGSGVLNSVVERFRTDTIGLARTEQIGLAKNTVVGNIMTTSVGKTMKVKVGEDYDLETKKSIFSRTVKHTLHAKEKFIIGGPGGTIIIDSSGVTIKARHLKIKSPNVDFSSGNPDQVDALNSDKAFVQECKAGKGEGQT